MPVVFKPDDGLVVDDGPSMSVVTGGLVLVIVAVVVGVADGSEAEAENEGVTKFRGACSGWLNCRATNVPATMRTPITATPATLAPTTAGVRLCHGSDVGDCSWSRPPRSLPVTATDTSRGLLPDADSAELRDDFVGEERKVVEVGHIEKLQVNPLDAGLDVGAELVCDLSGRSDGRGVAVKLADLSADGRCAPRDLGVVAPRAHHECR